MLIVVIHSLMIRHYSYKVSKLNGIFFYDVKEIEGTSCNKEKLSQCSYAPSYNICIRSTKA